MRGLLYPTSYNRQRVWRSSAHSGDTSVEVIHVYSALSAKDTSTNVGPVSQNAPRKTTQTGCTRSPTAGLERRLDHFVNFTTVCALVAKHSAISRKVHWLLFGYAYAAPVVLECTGIRHCRWCILADRVPVRRRSWSIIAPLLGTVHKQAQNLPVAAKTVTLV